VRKVATRGAKGAQFPRRRITMGVQNHCGGAKWLRMAPKSLSNSFCTRVFVRLSNLFWNLVTVLSSQSKSGSYLPVSHPKDLRFEDRGRQTCFLARAPSNLDTLLRTRCYKVTLLDLLTVHDQ